MFLTLKQDIELRRVLHIGPVMKTCMSSFGQVLPVNLQCLCLAYSPLCVPFAFTVNVSFTFPKHFISSVSFAVTTVFIFSLILFNARPKTITSLCNLFCKKIEIGIPIKKLLLQTASTFYILLP